MDLVKPGNDIWVLISRIKMVEKQEFSVRDLLKIRVLLVIDRRCLQLLTSRASFFSQYKSHRQLLYRNIIRRVDVLH